MLNICISNETVTRNLNNCLLLRWITNTNFLNSRQSQKYLLIAVTIVINITIVIIVIVVTHIMIVITKIIILAILKLQLKDCLLYYMKLVN